MYKTVKELHIEIEQRIQQITSNRHRSIPPQWLDMMLNRTAVKYIQTKSNRKTNYKGEGFEDSKKRVDDIQSLKRETSWIKVKKIQGEFDYPNRAFVILPGDYLKLITSTSRYTYGKPQLSEDLHKVYTGDDVKNLYYHIIDITELAKNSSEASGSITIGSVTFDISDIIKLCDTDSDTVDLFEIATLLCDRISYNLKTAGREVGLTPTPAITPNEYDVYWENIIGRYYKNCIIITSNINDAITITVNDTNIPVTTYNTTFDEFVNTGNKYSENDLVSTENVRSTINNFYANKNRHLNPITELVDDMLFVYYDDTFCVDAIKVSYIKKPRPFNSDIDQMSDMEITPEFMDMVVSDILLILKDDSFNAVKQQSNFE